ncbi:major capsid protein [Microvirus mar34]|uniref:Major capsid protein n=1 Tax=Microvirus mar34 TaxID=2851168 RepID=A0A8F5MJN1_9VIRU|nr:major capsid protein [Microvirus mar34]
MADKVVQVNNASQEVRFSRAMFGECERSRMVAHPERLTAFDAGEIVPIYCREVLPEEELSIDVDFTIRQTTLKTPTMGSMKVDIYAFFVPNRIVNQSWKAVMGENYSGSWTANSISLAPLKASTEGSTQIPVGSVADHYDFPWQAPIPNSILAQCNDLKFRGYVFIYNEHFRDQNYQPPIPMSTLNVYQGFLDSRSENLRLNGLGTSPNIISGSGDGGFPDGAVTNALYGSSGVSGSNVSVPSVPLGGRFSALDKPLKANKLHDYFTSVLPSPQKSQGAIFAPVSGNVGSVNVYTSQDTHIVPGNVPLHFFDVISGTSAVNRDLGTVGSGNLAGKSDASYVGSNALTVDNLVTAPIDITGLSLDVNDIRMASAIQQVYEVLARGGSRYRSIVATFFGVDVDDPFSDIPQCVGHISRDLDYYQTAQTSASVEGSSPQGNLAGFGYTNSGGHLFSQRFLEHGYLHIFAVVRHRNIYSTFLSRDNFRLNMLDFYFPQLANISEQPVRTYEINPFAPNPNGTFGYQEAWAEYRFEPDTVTGFMRPGLSDTSTSFAVWNYADAVDTSLQIADGNWLKSNSEEVLNRTVAVTSEVAPQFKAKFSFSVDKTLPMPTYSVPGMDII